jgi:hypothetical protein
MRSLAARVYAGEIDLQSAAVRSELRRRSWRFNLEVDVAGNMTIFTAPLAQLYGDARFVMLVRDCFSWLDAKIESRRVATAGPAHPDLRYETALMTRFEEPFSPQESGLREARLLPIATYLRSWASQTQTVLDAVPSERLLVVRTEDLDQSTRLLAEFAGVPEDTVHTAHANHRTERCGLLAHIPPEFVVARAREHCAPLMERHWGSDWEHLADRLPSKV